jgi:hypothetical protein
MSDNEKMTEEELQEYIDSIKITDFNNYVHWANQTLSLKFSTQNVSDVTLHGAIGIATEAGEILEAVYGKYEVDAYNLKEELGDLMWYIACVARDNGLDLEALIKEGLGMADRCMKFDLISSVALISTESGQLLDILKKSLFYKENGDVNTSSQAQAIGDCLVSILGAIHRICCKHGWSLKDEVCLVNIKKLAKRYGKEFSSDAALKRNLGGERDILEGKS